MLSDIIGSTLANKMGKNDPEYKNFKENFDQVNTYFIDRFNYIADELVYDIFTEINMRSKEIVSVVTKNMIDFCDLSAFFVSCMEKVNSTVMTAGTLDPDDAEESNLYKMIIDCFLKLGNAILNEDPQQTELYFLEYCLDGVLQIMVQNEFKRNQMIVILYCFCQNTANAHLRVLRKIRQLVGPTHSNEFIYIVNSLLEIEQQHNDENLMLWGSPDLFDFYFEVAQRGLQASQPLTKTKALSILSQLAPCSLRPIFELIPQIKKMVSI